VTALAALGSQLRQAGLSARALAAWAGSDRLSALPALVPTNRPLTPAATLLALFVAGEQVPLDRVRLAEALKRELLLDVDGDRVHARVSILPLGEALLVCDRLDTSDSLDVVCWPDDSSYHLARSLPPGRVERWLDLGCGSGFAALLRPELAEQIVGADLNARAIRYATLGGALSGIRHARFVEADLGDGVPHELRGSCALVTCNAPIPEPTGGPYRARWRATDPSFVERLFVQARTFVAPEGMIVVHAALDALEPVLAELWGHRVVIAYTPEGVRGFAVAWWRPDGETRMIRARRVLTPSHPHLTHEDRLDALTRTLAPL
jgi:SAM-dependent methyltransferase